MYIVYVVVNFLFQLIFIFPLFLGMVMYAKQFKTKEKQNLTEIKKLTTTYTRHFPEVIVERTLYGLQNYMS